jgi:hypothetical protein
LDRSVKVLGVALKPYHHGSYSQPKVALNSRNMRRVAGPDVHRGASNVACLRRDTALRFEILREPRHAVHDRDCEFVREDHIGRDLSCPRAIGPRYY